MKPENLLIQPCNDTAWGTQQADSCLHLRLIDFGSAVEPTHGGHLYGPQGPSAAEQTAEYAPPEALLPDRSAMQKLSRTPREVKDAALLAV